MENKSDKSDKKDYIVHLNKARKKRNKNDFERYIILAVIAVVVVVILLFAGKAIAKRVSAGAEKTTAATETESQAEDPGQLKIAAKEAEESEAEAQAKKTEEEKKAVVDSYQNLGIVLVSGYLNVRKEPNTSADIVGKLMGDSACEILDSTQEGWYKISSGGIEGYIDSQYVLTGDEAKTKAYELVTLRAIVQVDNLNIRKEANTTSDVVGQGLINERYEVIDQVDGWVQIPSGYMSADYVKLEYALNEARKLDLKAMIFNMYKNIGISDVDNYLNVREEPSEDGKVIAKMPSKAAGNILETTDNGWYKIQSGKITGYVKSDYILTGQAAKDEALKVAELMAIVNTDMLNARSEPSTDSKIWTQISNNEKYPVLKQIDGWVEIELEEDSNAYVASDYVDVRYARPEA
ncbi:SH3 domain-containing protein, partial [Hungatella effluvii]|uniref:SH3 domain-containing protein n=1 Tax=Hungatella effluvii TaxID=1096246 RepID=UPI002A81AE41